VAARLLQVVVFPYRGCSFTPVARSNPMTPDPWSRAQLKLSLIQTPGADYQSVENQCFAGILGRPVCQLCARFIVPRQGLQIPQPLLTCRNIIHSTAKPCTRVTARTVIKSPRHLQRSELHATTVVVL
jgi:hypothetical protein